MEERNWRHCKICGELKPRVMVGRFSDKKDKKYVDDAGSLWNGKTCPDCHRLKAKETMKISRTKHD